MPSSKHSSAVKELKEILGRFDRDTIREAVQVSDVARGSVTNGGISQSCGGAEEEYWSSTVHNGTVSITNNSNCVMQARVVYAGGETKTLTAGVRGQTKSFAHSALRSLHVKCEASSEEDGRCVGTYSIT